VVCADAATALEVAGDPLVLKPLGPGHFHEQGVPQVVYASEAAGDAPELATLGMVRSSPRSGCWPGGIFGW
jgi:hypothetical protein